MAFNCLLEKYASPIVRILVYIQMLRTQLMDREEKTVGVLDSSGDGQHETGQQQQHPWP